MRAGDLTQHHYTMMTSTIKTPSAAPHLFSSPHANPLSYPHNHPNTHPTSHPHASPTSTRPAKGPAATPLASPRLPYSAGQTYPPRLSPAATRGSEKRSSSPSYFGLVVDDTADPRDSSVLPRHNWTPPSSSVKPFAAAVPKHVPLDGNPEFEAFRRQVDAYRDKGLSLSTATYTPPGGASLTANFIRPQAPRSHTHVSDSTTSSDAVSNGSGGAYTHAGRTDMDQDSLHDSAYVSGDSKRNSEGCVASPRFPSVSEVDGSGRSHGQGQGAVHQSADDRGRSRGDQPPGNQNNGTESRTTPFGPNPGGGPSMMTPDQLGQALEDPDVRLLLIDVRSAQSYARSRIRTALNLCIP
ncbi:hypothetical protein IMZ48_26685, partial [Candidatus Bathyarchaeota archaeon]|nr:hypothetical protein [Candidatus Bathyarchaeota archaeon]